MHKWYIELGTFDIRSSESLLTLWLRPMKRLGVWPWIIIGFITVASMMANRDMAHELGKPADQQQSLGNLGRQYGQMPVGVTSSVRAVALD